MYRRSYITLTSGTLYIFFIKDCTGRVKYCESRSEPIMLSGGNITLTMKVWGVRRSSQVSSNYIGSPSHPDTINIDRPLPTLYLPSSLTCPLCLPPHFHPSPCWLFPLPIIHSPTYPSLPKYSHLFFRLFFFYLSHYQLSPLSIFFLYCICCSPFGGIFLFSILTIIYKEWAGEG